MTPADFFCDHPLGLEGLDAVLAAVSEYEDVEVRVSKSQLAIRRRRGFAYLWLPDRYLGAPSAGIVVLSIALGRAVDLPRFKEVDRVSPAQWMHHLEIRDPDAIDEPVVAWLREAADRAG